MSTPAEIAALATASRPLGEVRAAVPGGGEGTWLVGGGVRDLLLGLELLDIDLATTGDPRRAAMAVQAALGGHIFALSDRFGTWRATTESGLQVDITGLRGETIDQDLRLRDFTVNAMALSLDSLVLEDPLGGQADLDLRRLRLASPGAYDDDPLRPLRLPRLAATLGFEVDAETADATRARSALIEQASPERVFAELRALIGSNAALRGLALLDELGLTAVVLPELKALQGIEQTVYHHKDVYGHTLEVLGHAIELEQTGYELFGDHAQALAELLGGELADEITLAGGLRWGALLHDIAKPLTQADYGEGRIGFPGHDIEGAGMARAICRRLNTSERFAGFVSAITRSHMRLGFLVREQPLTRRQIYQYLVKSTPVEVEVGVFSVADRMATRGRKHEQAIPAHIELAIEMTGLAFDFRANPARPLIRGDDLASALDIEPGPRLGELLAEIAEAQYAQEIATADEAIAMARDSL